MADPRLEAEISANAAPLEKAADDAAKKLGNLGSAGKSAIRDVETAAKNINLEPLKSAFGDLAGAISADMKKPVMDITETVTGIATAISTGNWAKAVAGGIKMISDAITAAKREAEAAKKLMENLDHQRRAAESQQYKAEAGALARLASLNSNPAQNGGEIARLVGVLNQAGYNLGLDANGGAVGVANAYAMLEQRLNAEDNADLERKIADLNKKRLDTIADIVDEERRIQEIESAVADLADTDARKQVAMTSAGLRRAANERRQGEITAIEAEIGTRTAELRANRMSQMLAAQAPGMLADEAARREQARRDAEAADIKVRRDAIAEEMDAVKARRDAAAKEFAMLTDGGKRPRNTLDARSLRRADMLADAVRGADNRLNYLVSIDQHLKNLEEKAVMVQNRP